MNVLLGCHRVAPARTLVWSGAPSGRTPGVVVTRPKPRSPICPLLVTRLVATARAQQHTLGIRTSAAELSTVGFHYS